MNVDEAVTIMRPAAELYQFWRDFEQLPRFMQHLVSVNRLDERRSHWVAKAPAGRTVEWDAEIINERAERADRLAHARHARRRQRRIGAIRRRWRGRGTEVRVRLQYDAAGRQGRRAVAWLFGHEPSQQIREDLRALQAADGNGRGADDRRVSRAAAVNRPELRTDARQVSMKALVWHGTNDVRVETRSRSGRS